MARLCRLAVIASLSIVLFAAPADGRAGAADYVVDPGDTLSGIAAQLGVRLSDLLRVNDLTATETIYPGQRLTVPGTGGGGPAPTPSGGNYTVRAGDSLFAIAHRHGVSLAALLRANNLTATQTIHPGQRLTVPRGVAPAPDAPPPAGGRSYTVRAGDSLSVIADRSGVSLGALVAANDMAVTDLILPGMVLRLPAGAGAPLPSGGGGSPVDRVVSYALAQVGKPWRFFSSGPHAFDCSGLALAAYRQAGIRLVHHSASQANQGRAVNYPSEPIRRGDLVFTNTHGGKVVDHVGIALDSDTWVQARAPGFGVQVTPMPSDRVILAVRRFLPSG